MELPATLRSSRKEMLPLLLGALFFVALGVWVASFEPAIGWLAIGFFGLCAVGLGVNFLPNSSYLRLTREGFTFCTMFKRRSVAWREVSKFGVTRIGVRNIVGWDPSHGPAGFDDTAKVLTGYASTLPETYGLTAEELAELLNCLRDEYATQTS
jgi:hypothetical protein